jgi:hypothetical protein
MTSPIIVFVGPSLPAALRPEGPFDWRAPARAGDMLALLDRPPAALCLIDGYFDWCPAPWHKELLLLMARGTRLFGASSMGALRAAELEPFGMVGIGAIFRAYRDGRLHGDDEVALIHATAEMDWEALSVPMVELRATLVAACGARLIEPGQARRVRAIARRIHYSERDWPAIHEACRAEAAIDPIVLRRLEAMHVPLKRLDALACLEAALGPPAPERMKLAPPATCFIADLASELGLPAPAPDGFAPAPPRSRRSDTSHARSAQGDAA